MYTSGPVRVGEGVCSYFSVSLTEKKIRKESITAPPPPPKVDIRRWKYHLLTILFSFSEETPLKVYLFLD